MNLRGQQTQKDTLDCSVRLDHYTSGEVNIHWFCVEVLQSDLMRKERQHGLLKVLIDDISNGFVQAKPILSKCTERNSEHDTIFSCESSVADILKNLVLSERVPVARIECNQLLFPQAGLRTLQFQVYLQSGDNRTVLADGHHIIEYHNPDLGYVDMHDNKYKSKTLGLALAANAVDCDHCLSNRQLGLLRGWVLSEIDLDAIAMKSKRAFEKSFQRLISRIRKDGLSELESMCKELGRIAPSSMRYDILSLALELITHSRSVKPDSVHQLMNMVKWLSLDMDRFRALLNKRLPLHKHKEIDLKILLGITSDMSQEQTLKQLHQEYAKWNARITNPDKNVRQQADQMLEQIAEMYNQQTHDSTASEPGSLTPVAASKEDTS